MREVIQLTNNKYLNIKEVRDPENHINGYQFAERLGVDSVAFICVDKKRQAMFLLNHESKPPIGPFLTTAFGGSLDKEKCAEEIVMAEVKEEAGYVVRLTDIKFLGKQFVSTQMNQFCYLYLVFVDKDNVEERAPENALEASAEPVWWSRNAVMDSQDWKAIAIIAKAEHQGLLNQ